MSTFSNPLTLPLPYRVKFPSGMQSQSHMPRGYSRDKSLFDRYIKLPSFSSACVTWSLQIISRFGNSKRKRDETKLHLKTRSHHQRKTNMPGLPAQKTLMINSFSTCRSGRTVAVLLISSQAIPRRNEKRHKGARDRTRQVLIISG